MGHAWSGTEPLPVGDNIGGKKGIHMSEKRVQTGLLDEQVAATKTVETVLLKEIVDQIRRDSVEDSKAYLDETTVPHGGE